MTITCEVCGQQHELFWLERKRGKRTVVFRCRKVEERTKNDEIRCRTRDIYWAGQDDPQNKEMIKSLPSVCTGERRKELLSKNQFQLIMTHDRPAKS